MSSDSKAIFEAIQYARGEKGMPEKGDPMYWDDAIGRVRFRSVKIIIDCPSNWMNWRIFLVHLDALFVCRFLMRCLFVCLHDDNDDEKSDALSLSLFLSSRLFSSRFSGCGSLFVF